MKVDACFHACMTWSSTADSPHSPAARTFAPCFSSRSTDSSLPLSAAKCSAVRFPAICRATNFTLLPPPPPLAAQPMLVLSILLLLPMPVPGPTAKGAGIAGSGASGEPRPRTAGMLGRAPADNSCLTITESPSVDATCGPLWHVSLVVGQAARRQGAEWTSKGCSKYSSVRSKRGIRAGRKYWCREGRTEGGTCEGAPPNWVGVLSRPWTCASLYSAVHRLHKAITGGRACTCTVTRSYACMDGCGGGREHRVAALLPQAAAVAVARRAPHRRPHLKRRQPLCVEFVRPAALSHQLCHERVHAFCGSKVHQRLRARQACQRLQPVLVSCL
eukprot:355041-Chlamydomonas_euryale.AAC.6